MLHLRILTPPELTATVLQELARDPGVTHITTDPAAATQPPGDLVCCDVVRASVNPLVRRLRAAGVTERGGITMTELEAVISTVADRAQAQILTPEIDTIVWGEVSARTSDDSALSVSFGVLMVLAGIIAAIAVITNNPGAGRRRHDRLTRLRADGRAVGRRGEPGRRAGRAVVPGPGHGHPVGGRQVPVDPARQPGRAAGRRGVDPAGTRVWARRIEAGQAIIWPKPKPGR